MVWYNVSTAVAEFKTETFNVTVSDGTLNFWMANCLGINSTTLIGLEVRQGVLDTDGWLQYQIDQAEILAEENYNDNVGVVVLFFTAGISISLALIYAKRKK